MRIVIAGSMHHAESMIVARDELIRLGHEVFVSKFIDAYIGKPDHEKEILKADHKHNHDAIKEFWELMQTTDALLVLNLDRHGIANYIGGNALMEIGFAYVLNQKIFLYNPIPDIPYYKSEIEAVKPTIIYGDFSLVK